MAFVNQSASTLSQCLTDLAESCRDAGATASTVIYSKEKVVVFYQAPQEIGIVDYDKFDELHIRHKKNACILIAVFVDEEIDSQ